MSKDTERHSEPVQTPDHRPLTPEERAPIEAANGFRQFDRLMGILQRYLSNGGQRGEPLVVQPWMLMELARLAVDQIIANPGAYRQTPMTIRKKEGVVKHEPPRWEDVPQHVDEMCDYVNKNWNMPALHLAAYLLWRVNWIHPFSDGNGRTARSISYLVLCAKLRQRLPGDRTMPDFISDDKEPYYTGLEAADEAFTRKRIDVSALEAYLRDLLVDQVTRAATTGEKASPPPPPPAPKQAVDMMAEALGVMADAARAPKSHKSAWIAAGAVVITALIGAGVTLARCGKEARCIPNEQKACACAGGLQGIQKCDDDGAHFQPCACPPSTATTTSVAPDAGALDANSSADAGLGSAVDASPP